MADAVGVAIVGCGVIAREYARSLADCPWTDLVGATDLDPSRAEALTAEHGGRAFPDLDALAAHDGVDLVVNLTVHHAHVAVTRRLLEAGRHVYSEKPLAMTHAEAEGLVRLARERGLRLGCSPFTFLGEAQQTAWRRVRDGALGAVRVAYAEVNWGRIETWHPEPRSFYEVGPLFDVGVYPLTILTAMFGPARTVTAVGRVLHPHRTSKRGEPFEVETPDFVVAMIELEGGPLVRLTTNFYVPQQGRQAGIELHGDLASLHLASWHEPDGAVAFAPFGEDYAPVPLVRPAGPLRWGLGVEELAAALLADRPHRVTGEQAAHVVEILEGARTSLATGTAVRLSSDFPAPLPMEWAG